MNQIKFIKHSNKKYEATNIGEIIKEENQHLQQYYINGLQELLVYDLLLKNVTYRITSEFFKQGYIIDNELDVLNIIVNKELLILGNIPLVKNDMVISLGVYKEEDEITHEIKKRYVFGRC